MSKWNTILFDLDGTLTESAPGITNGVSIALKSFGIDEKPCNLMHFVGPPMHESFMQFYHFNEEDAFEGVRRFRQYYTEKGWLENAPYEGILPMLEALKKSGKKLILATSKPRSQAMKVVEHFSIMPYLDYLGASDPNDPESCQKPTVIRNALKNSCSALDDGVIMVGDRKFDVLGAHQVGIPVIGVLYGYGTQEELQAANADYLVRSVQELHHLLID